jgi:periplasmic protein TonB
MRDPVAEVLLERAALDRDASVGVAISILLHAGLTALAVYAALHAPAPQAVRMVNIQFASTPAAAAPAAAAPAQPSSPAPQPVQPRIEEPKPVIAEPKPPVTPPAAKPEKNTVPISPFGRSTKKGSETPAATPPTPPPAPAGPSTGIGVGVGTADVPVGGSGVTGLEGGDFPYTLYIDGMQRRIGGNWFRPQVPPGTAAVIYFRIQRDGTITDPRIQTPSGNSAFDRAALSAVRSSAPLNPLPFAYNGNYLGVHLTFR